MGDKGGPKETSQERANAQVLAQKVAYFRQKLAPLQRENARQVDASGAANSSTRLQARGTVNADSTVAFHQANDALDKAAISGGGLNSSAQKLGVTSMGNDQATSQGLSESQADLNVDSARVAGLNNVVQIGQGKEALAVRGMDQQAQMAGAVAANDAQASLERNMGTAQLVGQGVGLAAGSYMNKSGTARPGDSSFPSYLLRK